MNVSIGQNAKNVGCDKEDVEIRESHGGTVRVDRSAHCMLQVV